MNPRILRAASLCGLFVIAVSVSFYLGVRAGDSSPGAGAGSAGLVQSVARDVAAPAPITRFSTPKEVFAHVHLGTVRRNGKNINAYSDATSAGPVECYEYYAAKKVKAPGAARPLPEWGLQVCAVDLSRKPAPPPGIPAQ